MNKQRAKEIMEAPNMIRVTHNGTPVYIQNVNDTTETARIYPLGNPEEEENVALNTLIEEQ